MNLRKQNQALQNLFSTGKSFLYFWSGLKSVCIQIIMYCLSSAATYLPNNPYMALGSAKHGVPNQYMALGSEKCGVSILGLYHQGRDLFKTLSF